MEEREQVERDGAGRRGYDKMKCPNCDLLWTHLTKDRQLTREQIDQDIEETKTEVAAVNKRLDDQVKVHSAFVPRWMFISAFGLMLVAGGWWFNSFGNSMKEYQTDVKEKLTTIHNRITQTDQGREGLKDSLTEIKWSLNSVSNRLAEVEKKVNNQKP